MRRFTVDPARFRRVAYTALAFCTLIVFTGAAVRLTGSGLGCHDWPKCTNTRLVPQLQLHGLIEFSNRVMTTIVAVPCFAAAILAWFRRPFRRDLALLALLLPLGVLGQAVLGGLTVLYGLDPGWVIGHFLLSMALLVAAVALAWRATFEPGTRPRTADRLAVWPVRGLAVLGAVTIAAGHDRHRGRARTPAARARTTSSRGCAGAGRTRSTGRSTSTARWPRCSG